MIDSRSQDLKLQLAQLPTADRAVLATFLLASLPVDGIEVEDEAWAEELNRRVTEIESGAVLPIPAAQVLAELRSEFPVAPMKPSAMYVKIVEWSDEDQCFVGSCPGLFYGGCHGNDEQAVFAESCEMVDEMLIQPEKT